MPVWVPIWGLVWRMNLRALIGGIQGKWEQGPGWLGGRYRGSCLPAKPGILISGLTCGRPGASWAFLSCPPEDECANGHHDCNETQNCHDRPHGYECSCKAGYTMDK